MPFTKLEKDMGIIAKLEDEPNDVGGLTAAQLKDKFDEGGVAVKKYLNETLLPELAATDAAEKLGAQLNGESMSVQEALDELQVAAVKSGNVPVGGFAGDILRKRSDGLYDLEWSSAAQISTAVEFAQEDWTQGADGSYTLRIPAQQYLRGGAAFGCALRHRVNGALVDGTWATQGTQSLLDVQTGDVVLTAQDAYSGSAVLFG